MSEAGFSVVTLLAAIRAALAPVLAALTMVLDELRRGRPQIGAKQFHELTHESAVLQHRIRITRLDRRMQRFALVDDGAHACRALHGMMAIAAEEATAVFYLEMDGYKGPVLPPAEMWGTLKKEKP